MSGWCCVRRASVAEVDDVRQVRRMGGIVGLMSSLAFACYVGVPASSGFGAATDGPAEAETAEDESSGGTDDSPPSGEDSADIGVRWMSRLSRAEYGGCVFDVLGVEVAQDDLDTIPDGEPSPFDNDARTQTSSSSLVSAYERVARSVAERAVATPSIQEAVDACDGDAACFDDIVSTYARRLFRRPVPSDEVAAFVALRMPDMDDGDALRLILSAMLQDASFLFRVEIGEPVDGDEDLRRLDGVEVANRMSFLLWGIGPDDALLEAASTGTLTDADGRLEQVQRMLASPHAVRRAQRFFALWLGYSVLPHDDALSTAMQRESDALVARMWEHGDSWTAPFTASETFVTDALAEHYGLDVHAAVDGTWVDYGDSRRGGILSHGSFLALGSKFGDTSPVVRGLEVRRRLMCLDIPPPPPELEVDVDSPPPGESACKPELYAPMVENDACAVCHVHLNPLGFGLEAFDAQGRFRTHEMDAPQCPVEGKGELPGVGPFWGPGELGQLLVDTDAFTSCYATHLLRFWLARADIEADADIVDELLEAAGPDPTLQVLLELFVASEAFGYRLLPEAESP